MPLKDFFLKEFGGFLRNCPLEAGVTSLGNQEIQTMGIFIMGCAVQCSAVNYSTLQCSDIQLLTIAVQLKPP